MPAADTLDESTQTFVAPVLEGRAAAKTNWKKQDYVFRPGIAHTMRPTATGDTRRVTTVEQEPKPQFAPPRRIEAPTVAAVPFQLLQQWEGIVLHTGENEFTAELRDLTNPHNPLEQATFEKEEISPDDVAQIAPGAAFYWSIGYRTAYGQKMRVSSIRFRRLPAWTQQEMENGLARASELKFLFDQAD